MAGLAASFGSGAMSNSIADLKDAACFFIIGANTSETHPVIGFELKRAIKSGTKLIISDPLAVPLVRYSDIWLRQTPGTDVILLSAMIKVIIDEKLYDEAFIRERTENFRALVDSLIDFDLEGAATVTRVPLEDIQKAARLYANSKPASILYAMGITQHSHGTDNVTAIANLAMLCGNLGKAGAGVNPLRGQNNVQGACDMGALPDVLPGYQKVTDEASRTKFESAWGVRLPEKAGLTVTEITEGILAGKIKALYIVGENIMLSDPDLNKVRLSLEKLEFLIVQDIFITETTKLAHVVFPASSFAEVDGTFTNTERRVQRVKRAIAPIGESKPDWWIIAEISKRMGGRDFDYANPQAVFTEMKTLNPSYFGISYERLEQGGVQWPCPDLSHPGTPILHIERFTRGKGIFKPVTFRPPGELPDSEFPFILTTGRSPYHFHTGTMTRRVRGLIALEPREILTVNAANAASLGIENGDKVRVSSRRGSVVATARVGNQTVPGVVFMTIHFSETATNLLTSVALDPVAKIPELKVAAVQIEKIVSNC